MTVAFDNIKVLLMLGGGFSGMVLPHTIFMWEKEFGVGVGIEKIGVKQVSSMF